MTVEQLLLTVSSKELAEWQAFEVVNGPIGREYSDDMLACIHEMLQVIAYTTGAQLSPNPIPPPKPVTRPNEFIKRSVPFKQDKPAEEDDNEIPEQLPPGYMHWQDFAQVVANKK
jgi:hypothetical protein